MLSFRKGSTSKKDDKIGSLSPKERAAAQETQAVEMWSNAWTLLHDTEDWRVDKGKDVSTGVVHSKQCKGIGRVSKLECQLELSPDDAFDLLITNTENAPSWDHGVIESKIIEQLSDTFEVHHLMTREIAGGIIARRDYVSVRHWEKKDGIMLSIGSPTTHPDRPVTKKHVRGETRIAAFAFKAVEGESDKCIFTWMFNVNIGGWLPQFSIDQGLASAMMDFLVNLHKKIDSMKNEKTVASK